MKTQQIDQLIDRFFNGETTRSEEQQLYEFFHCPDLSAHLRPYASTFQSLAARQQPVPEQPAKPKPLLRRWAVAASIAAIFCLSVAAATITYHVVVEKKTEALQTSEQPTSPTATKSGVPTKMQEATVLADTLIFKNQSLAEIARQITAAFGCKVELADSLTADLRLYFTLPKGSTAADFATVIDDYEALEASIEGDTVTIKRQEAAR